MLSSRTNSFYQFQKCGHSLKRAYLEHLTQGLKLTFCHTCQWPVMLSNLPAKIFFYQTWNSFCKNRQLLLQWLNIFTMFLICPLLKRKQQQRDLLIYLFFFVHKKRWDSCSLHVFWQTEQAIVLCLFHTYSVCSAYVVLIFSAPMVMD